MFSRSLSASRMLSRMPLFRFSASKGANLYTWGLYASGTGFQTASNVPRRLEEFNGNVAKVSAGSEHTAVLTTSGEVYTFGNGESGRLGNGESGFELNPTLVSYFTQNRIKVVDILAGGSYTIAVTDSGAVFSWGYGGQPSSRFNLDFLRRILRPDRCGGLGSGNNLNRLTPDVIANLNAEGLKELTGGENFVNLITKNGDVVNWGTGLHGVLGNGSDFPLFTPEVNHYFKHLKEKDGVSVVSVKSAASASIALLSNGTLVSFGKNTQGQLGIRLNLGHTTDGIAILPTNVNTKTLQGQKVVDFQIGENTLVILTDKNQMFFSGLELAYMPIRWEIPTTERIISIAASKDSFAAVTESGKIYQFNDFTEQTTYEVGPDYNVVDNSSFAGKVKKIGGAYGIRYALVE